MVLNEDNTKLRYEKNLLQIFSTITLQRHSIDSASGEYIDGIIQHWDISIANALGMPQCMGYKAINIFCDEL